MARKPPLVLERARSRPSVALTQQPGARLIRQVAGPTLRSPLGLQAADKAAFTGQCPAIEPRQPPCPTRLLSR